MKKISLLTLLLVAVSVCFAQVPRDKVIVECGTSTLCTYCPGAALGIDDLVANGWPVAAVEYHCNGLGTDPFNIPASTARENYYGVPGYPTTYFDGGNSVVGGDHTQSMYPTYWPKVQTCMAIPSPVSLQVWGSHIGLNYNVTITVEKVSSITGTDPRLQVCVTESNIAYVWQGQTELDYVNRMMVPNENGTVLDFTNSSVIEVPLSFSLQSGWNLLNLELTVFVQTNSNKKIQQGYKVKLAFLLPPPPPLAASFSSDLTEVCGGDQVQYTDQSTGGPSEWYWEFPGGTPDTSREENPLISYNVPGQYDVTLTVIKGDDTSSTYMPNYITVNTLPEVTFAPVEVQCINYPAFELTQGAPIGGTYTGPGVTASTFDPAVAGVGMHTLTYTYSDENGCENFAEQTVVVDACTGIPEHGIFVTALPNPTRGVVKLNLAGKSQVVSYRVVNSTGTTVLEKSGIDINGNYTASIDLSGQANGIYYIRLESQGTSYFKKIILNK